MQLTIGVDGKKRCFGNKPDQLIYAQYHDTEWGRPCHDDQKLFEMLILEGAQAGLSWYTILKRREGYRQAFKNFNPELVANMSDAELDLLTHEPNIIRNKLKIYSARKNARVFLEIQKAFGSFDQYLWGYMKEQPEPMPHHSLDEIPTTTEISDRLSKDLKKRGMNFVGSTIIYAYMQAVGLVNDHLIECHLYNKI